MKKLRSRSQLLNMRWRLTMKTHQVAHLVAEESLAKVNLLALIITNILVKVVNCCGLLKAQLLASLGN